MIDKESRILIIDDEQDICHQLSGLLSDIGYICDYATTSEKGMELFKKNNFSLVLLDIWLNDSKFDGFQTLEQILSFDQNIPVIMISGHGNIETAVNSIKKGAYDFIEKPFESDLLIFKITKALENLILKKQLQNFTKKDSDAEIVANSKLSKILEKQIIHISKTDSNILLVGDHGCGKEFFATKVHNSSHRQKKNFKSLDCKINQDKLEKDIFGFEENNVVKVLGILDEVNNGTLYLKNISFISQTLQGKILRILEEKKYYRGGALNSNPLDIRVIASSQQNIKNSKDLRKDLLKKLNFNTIEIPKLNERQDDIEKLCLIFLEQISLEKGLPKKYFSNDALSYLIDSNLFKNVFQLKKFVEWILVMLGDKDTNEISKDILIELGSNLSSLKQDSSEESMNLLIKDARLGFEKRYLLYNLERFNYNISKMSLKIGMERTALYRKLKQLKIKTEF